MAACGPGGPRASVRSWRCVPSAHRCQSSESPTRPPAPAEAGLCHRGPRTTGRCRRTRRHPTAHTKGCPPWESSPPATRPPPSPCPTRTARRSRSRTSPGSQVVVYFYPRDDTPGCTKEACQFNDNLRAFTRAKVAVLGHLRRQRRQAPEVPGQVRPQVPPADRRRPLGGRGLRGLGREDPVRQEVDRGHPVDLPDRPPTGRSPGPGTT